MSTLTLTTPTVPSTGTFKIRLTSWEKRRILAEYQAGEDLDAIAARHGLRRLQCARILEGLLAAPAPDTLEAAKATWPDVDWTQLTSRELRKVLDGHSIPNDPVRAAVKRYLAREQHLAAALHRPAPCLSDLVVPLGFDYSQAVRFLGMAPGAPKYRRHRHPDGTVTRENVGPGRIARIVDRQHALKLAAALELDPVDIPGL